MKFYFDFEADDSLKEKCSEITGMSFTPDLNDADAVFFRSKPLIGAKTKILQRLFAGTDDMDLAQIPPGITVLSNAGGYNEPVSETVFALLLAHYKRICKHNSDMHSGQYKKLEVDTLYGKSMGIFGFGGIGRQVAITAAAFGMHVSAYSRNKTSLGGVKWVESLESLAESSDILVISTPLSDETLGIINAPVLKKFRGQCIVNIARPDIVDEKSMLDFLSEHKDKFYLTDVWWNEPDIKVKPPENCIVTPHIGGMGLLHGNKKT